MTFEHIVTYKYSCDHDGCVAQVKAYCVVSSDAWVFARKEGWINRGGKHFCRTHANNRDAIDRIQDLLDKLIQNKATVLDWKITQHNMDSATHTFTVRV